MAKNEKKRQSKSYSAIFWGLILILAAVVLILNEAGVSFGVKLSAWRIVLGAVFLAWLVYEIVRLRFSEIFFPLAFLFLVFQHPIAKAVGHGDNGFLSPWIVLLAALLFTIGFQFLLKKRDVKITVEDEDRGRIGDKVEYYDAADLSGVEIKEHIGTVSVYFSNRDAYDGNGRITVRENLGIVKLHIPCEWGLTVNKNDNLGKITIPEHEQPIGGKVLTVDILENMGEVRVTFD